MFGLTLVCKCGWDYYIVSIAKFASKKIEFLICCLDVLSPEVVFISINLLRGPILNAFVTSRLILLFTTWIRWISWRLSGTVGLHLLLLMSLWLFFEILTVSLFCRYYFRRFFLSRLAVLAICSYSFGEEGYSLFW